MQLGNRIRISPYTWDRGKPTAEAGFMLATEHRRMFIPEDIAVKLSDAIIDFIEQKDNTNVHD